jgi:sugar phosphate isomerase/epimerase
MNSASSKLPFDIGAPSMVYGEDLLKNARTLADVVDNVEIVLFHTPSLHNIPSVREIQELKKVAADKSVSFSVHLPCALEFASREKKKREKSLQLATDCINRMTEINPRHYILHIPFTAPTLIPVPGLYFTADPQKKFTEWTQRTIDSLIEIQNRISRDNKILVENINYSPIFLIPFLQQELCELCLDLGHLMLGQENVLDRIKQFLDTTREIHIHGVKGYREHLSLSVLPKERVLKWMRYLAGNSYRGVITLEVFTPDDLESSMNVLLSVFAKCK